MSSIKCPQCELVNFASATHCKRCQIELNNLAPIADQRNYQTPTNNLQTYEVPPPPPQFHNNQNPQIYQQNYNPTNCVKCGVNENLTVQKIKKNYVPPAVYLTILIGLLPAAILASILKVSHHINLAFCGECWSKYKNVWIFETLSTIGFILLFLFGIIFSIIIESWLSFFAFFIASSGIAAFGIKYKWDHSPKFKKINRKKIIIESKANGELVFER